MADLASILKDPNYVKANATTKAAIFEKYSADDPNFAQANDATKAAIRTKFGIVPRPSTGVLTKLGRGLASAVDNTVGGVVPFVEGQATYATLRALGKTPEAAQATANKVSQSSAQPLGKLFGVTNTPEYQGEASNKAMQFIASNVGKGAKWIADKSGIPESDVANMIGTLSTAVPAVGGKAVRAAAPAMRPLSDFAARAVEPVKAGAASAARTLKDIATTRPTGIGAAKGGGAMDTPATTLRQITAEGLRRPIQLTKGQLTRDPAQLRFENEVRKSDADTVGKPLVERQIQQNEDVLANFDAYLGATGADYAGPGQLRPVGVIVNKALVDHARSKKQEVRQAYTAARAAGELEEPVSYIGLSSYIDQQNPTTRAQLAPILQAVQEQLRANDPHASGNISINGLEDVRQMITKNTQQGTPNAVHARELKNLIDEATDGRGGSLYQAARQKRIQYAKQFENVGAVDKLLRQKPGTTDRAVAFEDVFNHAVLDGSLDDTMAIGRTLKRAGPDGQQAWKELQGQTIQHIRDQITKSPATDPAGNPFPSPAKFSNIVRDMDSDGKLEYLFGKQGAQELRNLNKVVQDAYTAPPGTINFSNTAGIVVQALEKLESSLVGKIPGISQTARLLAERTRAKEKARRVEDALYPNAPIPDAVGAAPKRKILSLPPRNTNGANNNSASLRGTP